MELGSGRDTVIRDLKLGASTALEYRLNWNRWLVLGAGPEGWDFELRA